MRSCAPFSSSVGMRLLSALTALFALALLGAGAAGASEILGRDVVGPTLKVNTKGEALVGFKANGKTKQVLVWGAVNAIAPTSARAQVAFKIDYAGGWGKYRKLGYAATFKNACRPYDGPELAWAVTACKAPDGSYWALQRWQRALPNLGLTPWKTTQSVWELHLSHWTGPLPVLEAYTDWIYSKRFHHIFGRLTYLGAPVHGFKSTSSGVPLDSFGRNVFLDTLNSAYGEGWKRENSFLAQNPSGVFCYGFYTHPPYAGYPAGERPMGHGERYRITAIGPGVTPTVYWEGAGLPAFDRNDPEHAARELELNALQRELAGPGGRCVLN